MKRFVILFALAVLVGAAGLLEAAVEPRYTLPNGDQLSTHKVHFNDAKTGGVDTLTENEADTSSEIFNMTGYDQVILYTYANQLTSNDTVFVNAMVKDPWGTYTNVALDTLLGDAGTAVKNVGSLVNIYNQVKVKIHGGVSSGVDSTEVKIGFDLLRKSR